MPGHGVFHEGHAFALDGLGDDDCRLPMLIVVDENYVLEGKVKIELGEIIDGDLESFLDLLDEKLTDGLMLQEINYEMIKCIPKENSIIFNISGDISDRVDEIEDECFDFIDEYIEDENENEYEKRLDRKGKAVPEYAKFELENSIKQQREYLKMADEIKEKYPHIKVINLKNDRDFEEVKEELNKILNI